MNPVISIIICTRNRATSLRETLTSFAGMRVGEFLPAELLVVDNGSTDTTRQVVETSTLSNMTVRYLLEPRAGQCFARNLGLAEARGDVIVFTDDDVRPLDGWLERLAQPIIAKNADAVQGGYVHPRTHLRPWMSTSNAHGPMTDDWLRNCKPDSLIGLNMAFGRHVLQKVPAFDVELGPGQLGFADDSLFGMQLHAAGFRIVAEVDAKIEHHYDLSRLSRAHLLKRARAAGRSNAYLDYHWHHKTVEKPGFILAKMNIKMPLMKMRRWRDVRAREGLSQWENDALQWKAYLEQMCLQQNTPRKYEKHGLRKIA